MAESSTSRARLAERMAKLGVQEADLEEVFARSSGPGGQNVNKVSTAVTLLHRPSGMRVTVQDSRSQAMNRALARMRLLDLLEEQRSARRRAQAAALSKRRRQTAKRSRSSQRKILEGKRHRSEVKKLRRPPE